MDRVADLFKRNVTALYRHHRQLAEKLLTAKLDPGYHLSISRSGMPVPAYRGGESEVYLNSGYDPEKEARRFADSINPAPSYLLLGLEGGYSLRELLRRDVELVVVVDYDSGYLRFLLENFDFEPLLLDPRLTLILHEEPDDTLSSLLSTYIPLIHGDLTVVSQRSRERMNRGFFLEVRNLLPKMLGYTAVDISTQKRFALRWMRNITKNCPVAAAVAEKSYAQLTTTLPGRVHVTAAGPSLESALPALRKIPKADRVVATDTSLPFLIASGIEPDFVVSVDCQNHSYHHFISGTPGSTLVLGLTSPPSLFRLKNPVIPIAGGHPFSTYICRYFYRFIPVDTSGGNVTHAAVSFADRFGAQEIVLHGADFCYPEGKLYAKGTYLYSYFSTFENRFNSLETMTSRMLYEKTGLERTAEGEDFRYVSPLLESYRQRLIDSAAGLLTPFSGKGGSFPAGGKRARAAGRGIDTENAGIEMPRRDWTVFRQELLDELADLEIDSGPVQSVIGAPGKRRRHLLFAVMPLAALHLQEGDERKGSELLELAISQAWNIIKAHR